ncbi:hypothetical protein [Fibrobacter succinogenes]|uniref:hypothetical protein n=1 Tax=Fibrobacter succinogenes TaxID=833 RepID=UPI001568D03F|nr:hypothetical protein [Fibrobacter succinogenes]
MKKVYQYMMILMAGVLGACGSMSVNDPYAEALPADFNTQEYLALHPILAAQQYKDFVSDHNAQAKVNDSSKAADKAAFAANMDAIAFIYTNPLMEAHSQEQWAQFVADLSSPESSTKAQGVIDNLASSYNFDDTTDDVALLSSVQIDYLAIAQQFTVFGRDHGWAYRYCHPDEAANTPRSLLRDAAQDTIITMVERGFKPDTGLYCRDAAGIVRLIQ